jgi:hypothetical protein
MISPEALANAVLCRLNETTHSLCVYWFRVTTEREPYRSLLEKALHGTPILALTARGDRFDNANAVLEDLLAVLVENRDLIQLEAERLRSRCGIVLLARTELGIPQLASPIELPEWFPCCGGLTTSVLIEDLTWTADGPLSAEMLQVNEISALLFALEGALVARLSVVRSSNHGAANPLLEILRRSSDPTETYESILDRATQYRLTVFQPEGFRPSVREGRSLIARLWTVVSTCSPEQLGRPSKALAAALQLPSTGLGAFHEPLIAVVARPTTWDSDVARRFARTILTTICAASQLITASAHADDYRSYPLELLRTFSFDLRRALRNAEAILSGLP